MFKRQIETLAKALHISIKDAKIYFFKWPNVMFGLILPIVLYLAFAVGGPITLSYALPGLVAMAALFGAGAIEAVALPLERRTGTFERLLAAPVSLFTIILGKVFAGFFFGLLLSVAYTIIIAPFFGFSVMNVPLFIMGMLVSSWTFSALGIFISAPFRDIPEAMPPATLIRILMVFLCGVFTPIESLPMPLQPIGYLLPLTYSVDALRQAMSGPINIQMFFADLGVQIFYSIIFLVAATKVLESTIE